MTLDGRDAENMMLGERTRELMRSFAEFVAMMAVDAPAPMISRQIDEMDHLFREIDKLTDSGLYESDAWGTIGDMSRLMRLYEVLAQRHRDA